MTKDFRVLKSSIKDLDGENLFWAVIEPIWPDESVDDELEHISHGTPGQRAIYVTTLFMREVDNGGLEQFFWNSSGIYTEEVLKGFKRLGMNDHAEVLEKAFSFFPDRAVPIDRDKRQEYLKKREDELEAFFEPLNDQLYGEDRLYPYFREYIDSHPEEFFSDESCS